MGRKHRIYPRPDRLNDFGQIRYRHRPSRLPPECVPSGSLFGHVFSRIDVIEALPRAVAIKIVKIPHHNGLLKDVVLGPSSAASADIERRLQQRPWPPLAVDDVVDMLPAEAPDFGCLHHAARLIDLLHKPPIKGNVVKADRAAVRLVSPRIEVQDCPFDVWGNVAESIENVDAPSWLHALFGGSFHHIAEAVDLELVAVRLVALAQQRLDAAATAETYAILFDGGHATIDHAQLPATAIGVTGIDRARSAMKSACFSSRRLTT